jgi:ketosteroid isomerase-like protein
VGERENTKLVQQAYQHFKNGDIQSVLGLLSEDVEWTLEGGTRRPRLELITVPSVNGSEGWRNFRELRKGEVRRRDTAC